MSILLNFGCLLNTAGFIFMVKFGYPEREMQVIIAGYLMVITSALLSQKQEKK